MVIHIHERRKIEEELQKNKEEQFKIMVRTSLDGFWITDVRGRFLEVNDTYCQLTGYSREELLNMTLSDVEEPLLPEATGQRIKKIIEMGSDRFETQNRCKDGRILTIEASVNYSSFSGGQLYCFLRDITDRRERDKALRLAGSVFNAVAEAVMVTDPDNLIVTVNPAFISTTGYSFDEVIGKDPRILSSGRHPPEFFKEMWETLLSTGSWQGEIWDRRKNGELYFKWMSIKLVHDESGKLTHHVAIFADISERKAAEEHMQHLAHHDMLTGLSNRALFTDRLQHAIVQAKRDKSHMAMLFLDLDKFKPINDTLGHDIGDLLLKEVAKRMQNCVRESDTVARLGGDEFVVLLPAIKAGQNAVLVAEKIRHAINQPFELAGHSLYISSSIGVAIYPEHGSDENLLIKNADTAMYYAKESGRNAVRLFSTVMQKNN